MVIPSALAVLRLTTSSNLVGCSIGRSPGLAPFRILSTYPADSAEHIAEVRPIGHQRAVVGELPRPVDRLVAGPSTPA